jgi:hypothetical protein
LTRIKADAGDLGFIGGVQNGRNDTPPVIELDARGLEPPQPLMKTLEAVATLPELAELRVHTRWRPALLYAELESRGFIGESLEQPDGSYITCIRRR